MLRCRPKLFLALATLYVPSLAQRQIELCTASGTRNDYSRRCCTIVVCFLSGGHRANCEGIPSGASGGIWRGSANGAGSGDGDGTSGGVPRLGGSGGSGGRAGSGLGFVGVGLG